MTATTLPDAVGVYGGGRMGGGIAHVFAVAGARVTVVESDAETAAAARARIETSLAKAVAKGAVVEGAVEVVDDPAALARCPLVVEAVPELVDVKRQVLERITAVAPDAVIGSNTSSLSIDQLADALPDPSRLVGLHFFNPVPVSDLVEIVVGARTAPGLVADAQAWVAALGKTAITVRDSPGFASSRLGVALALEAMRMLDEGVASAADIDTAMTLGYRHPVGPLRTTDIVGLDVRLAIAEHLERELGPRFAPPQVLRDKVAAGHLGRKTGQGFYQW
ncbi:3-hydroxyacyl-CoA dehydrogenase family protein [Nocardioides bizhenqiangii]|uniref:3-hydroxyacyl-CoA dehydrogenase family protein n=1 Tax=Nocardioides bizhenqiangii TaxID=3095076 RepID=A0ABZ0ZTH9_9ACTN|nr:MULTISPECIES: 3-hydroxyacyl-CoA dehydrogenase family protein [unclassified Nocardioides]MDZ5621735.1 3-hydroxyacyl-CoA dehydrogenase family protein [Nocardioides sp. HM23]WQQ27579.1 3-hydroxyacyl-CoA dehydrogenase family protein [Nocardioides sp. HM61]